MKLSEEIEAVNIPENIKSLTPLQQLAFYWGVITVILRFIKLLTGPKADKVINNILDWGKENMND